MTRHSFALLVLLTSVLMGCQIELTPIAGDQTTGHSSNVADSSGSTDDQSVPSSDQTSNVTLYWSAPVERVSGDAMTINEIGGYEIRYKKATDDTYTNVLINEAGVDQYSLTELEDASSYIFEVAVYDNNGIYSDFVLASAN